MNEIEQTLANLADTVIHAAANLVAANNPEYDKLITIGTGLVDQINAKINPTAAPAAQSVATTAASLAGAVAPTADALKTIGSGAATATQKAEAFDLIFGEVETIGAEIASFFHHAPAAAAPAASP